MCKQFLRYSYSYTIRCHPAVLNLLIEKGANLDVLDNKKLTPLQLAVKAGCLPSVNILIKHFCNINLQVSRLVCYWILL